MPPGQPCPALAQIRAEFEAHLAAPAQQAELRSALARQRSVIDSRAERSQRLLLNRKIHVDALRKALAAVAADIVPNPVEQPAAEPELRVPVGVVQEALVEIFGECAEAELVGALNKAVHTGKLSVAGGDFQPALLQ